jgi:8-amino-7-oxononanoate synthase
MTWHYARMHGSGSQVFEPLAQLRAAAGRRAAAGLRRTLVPRAPGEASLDLASNDYLGLAGHPRLAAAAAAAARTWGTGATGSRLVTGTTELHTQLEAELAEFCEAPAALVFSSGYLANLAVVTALAGSLASPPGGAPADGPGGALADGPGGARASSPGGRGGVLIVSDERNHASLVDACRLARGAAVRLQVTPHGDIAAVERALASRPEAAAVVIYDAVFSADGRLAPVASLHEVTRRNRALLVLDEAHSFGVVGTGGRGAAHDAGLASAPDVIRTLTLSKALAGQGGAVLGAAEVIDTLVDTGRGFIFDTGLAPPSAGAASEALRLLRESPELAEQARDRTARLAALAASLGLEVSSPEAAIASVTIGDPRDAVAAQRACAALGVRVGCFRPPSVPDGQACLRLTGRATLTENDLSWVARALAVVIEHCHHDRNTAKAGRYQS